MARGQNLRGGRPPNAGRKPGTPNKFTVELKAMIEGALEEVGGQKYLVGLARKSPEIFVHLLGKLLPKQLEHSGELNHRVDYRAELESAKQRARQEMQEGQSAVSSEQVC